MCPSGRAESGRRQGRNRERQRKPHPPLAKRAASASAHCPGARLRMRTPYAQKGGVWDIIRGEGAGGRAGSEGGGAGLGRGLGAGTACGAMAKAGGAGDVQRGGGAALAAREEERTRQLCRQGARGTWWPKECSDSRSGATVPVSLTYPTPPPPRPPLPTPPRRRSQARTLQPPPAD